MAAIEAPATALEQFLIATLYDGSQVGAAVEQLRQAGLGDKVDSWLSTGENLPVTADELGKALSDTVGRIAALTGLGADEVAQKIAAVLPPAVDAVSPNGELVS
ncbi:YidB family protein [Streptomyces aureocirculatus]|uniref:YidB family protein n=1 Tax=Streptomyces aureocirculatus TaxID=67275 RepID=UPI000562F5BC|nr:YidB family protein [Streptomyces aureocirculatus]